MTPSISSFKMADLMRWLEIEFTPIARAKGLRLIFVPCSLPVQSDRALLRRLLQNFISNAIKYTPRGRVLIGCRRRGQSLQIGVYDTGVGIPALKRGEIFKEFHRLEQGARTRAAGPGLSIVERLARVLNHGIAIDSVPAAARLLGDSPGRRSDQPHCGGPQHHGAAAPMSGALIVCIETTRPSSTA